MRELVVNIGSSSGFAIVFALLISANIWNLGTWYLGLPASSSHTLIGSIMGVGLANSLLAQGHVFGEGVNWHKVTEVFTSLLLSPLVGFVCSAVLLLIMKSLIRKPALFTAPAKEIARSSGGSTTMWWTPSMKSSNLNSRTTTRSPATPMPSPRQTRRTIPVDKKKARLNCIHHLLNQVKYQKLESPQITLPKRVHHEDYHRNAVPADMMIPDMY